MTLQTEQILADLRASGNYDEEQIAQIAASLQRPPMGRKKITTEYGNFLFTTRENNKEKITAITLEVIYAALVRIYPEITNTVISLDSDEVNISRIDCLILIRKAIRELPNWVESDRKGLLTEFLDTLDKELNPDLNTTEEEEESVLDALPEKNAEISETPASTVDNTDEVETEVTSKSRRKKELVS